MAQQQQPSQPFFPLDGSMDQFLDQFPDWFWDDILPALPPPPAPAPNQQFPAALNLLAPPQPPLQLSHPPQPLPLALLPPALPLPALPPLVPLLPAPPLLAAPLPALPPPPPQQQQQQQQQQQPAPPPLRHPQSRNQLPLPPNCKRSPAGSRCAPCAAPNMKARCDKWLQPQGTGCSRCLRRGIQCH